MMKNTVDYVDKDANLLTLCLAPLYTTCQKN